MAPKGSKISSCLSLPLMLKVTEEVNLMDLLGSCFVLYYQLNVKNIQNVHIFILYCISVLITPAIFYINWGCK